MSKEIRGLMEAYQAVYTPKELTEEQLWEGVEEWVNSLLEEGYDLSDYTWEEMYENYVTENWAAVGKALLGYGARGLNVAKVGAKPVLRNLTTKAGKYGAIGGLGLTADELLTRGAGRELGAKSLEQTRKLGPAIRGEPTDSAGTAKPSPSTGKVVSAAGGKGGSVTSGTKYAATLGGKKGNVTYDDAGKKTFTSDSYQYDSYDLVLEYLLSQGHAGTLEEANYVMLEMDAEMIGDIVEVMTPPPIMPPPVKAPSNTESKNKKKETGVTGDGKEGPMGGPYTEAYTTPGTQNLLNKRNPDSLKPKESGIQNLLNKRNPDSLKPKKSGILKAF